MHLAPTAGGQQVTNKILSAWLALRHIHKHDVSTQVNAMMFFSDVPGALESHGEFCLGKEGNYQHGQEQKRQNRGSMRIS